MKSLLLAASLLFFAPCVHAQSDAAAWSRDLDLLENELPKRHVNLFFKMSRDEYRVAIERLRSRLPRLSDDERYVETAKILATVGDAHTGLSMPPPTTALPFMVYRFREGLFIVNTTEPYAALLYGQVTHVNGRPIAEVENAIGSMVAHDNDAAVWLALGRLTALTGVLHGLGLIADTSGASLTVKKADGATTTVTMGAVSMAQRPRFLVQSGQAASLPLYRRSANRFYWQEYLPDTSILYVKYNSCREMKEQSFSDFTREVFDRVDKSPGVRLVVDLRNNGGGDARVFAPFMDELNRRPTIGESGRLAVVVGRQTFSSAVSHAVALKQRAKAVIVGEPTAGRPNHFGELGWLDLPGTGLKVSYSTRYFRESPNDTPTVEPDIKVDQTVAAYIANRDPVLERIAAMPVRPKQ